MPPALPPKGSKDNNDDDDDDSGGGGGGDKRGDGSDDDFELKPPTPAKPARVAPTPKASGTVQLVIKIGGPTKRREIDLRRVKDMAGLQGLIASECKALGLEMPSGGLRMQYTDSRGQLVTVSRSTTIDSIRSANELTMLPKEAKSGGSSGRSGRPQRGRSSSGDME